MQQNLPTLCWKCR